MTRTKKTLKGLMAMLVALAMTVALGVSMLASAADTATETVVVTQVIEKGTVPQRNSYTYVLTPKNAENPMPEGTKDGKYTLPVIKGETTDQTAPTFAIEIDISKPGVYEYVLQKQETTPNGDTFSPESHIFGYKVEVDEKTGELVAIPYICQSGSPIFSDPDENGYPTKLTLVNTIKGKPTTTTTTTTQKGSTRTVTTYRNGTVGTTTNTRARWVNTGDPNSLILWVAVLGVAALGLIILIIVRRRKEDDDEQNF